MAERQQFSSALHAARFAAGLFVVLVHFFPLPLAALGAPEWLIQAMNARNLASSFFFALSGFLVVMTAARAASPEPPGAFIVRRLARLWPAHAAGFLIMAPTAFVGLETVSSGRFCLEAAAWLSMAHGFWPSLARAYNGPAWAVTSFALGYCLAPFLVRLKGQPLSRLAAAAGLLWLVPLGLQAALIFGHPGHWDSQIVRHAPLSAELESLQLFIHTTPLFRLPEVLAGGFAALAARKVRFRGQAILAAAAIPAALAVVWIGRLPDRWLFLLTHAGSTPVLLLALVTLWHSKGWAERACDRPWLRRGGQAGILLYFLHRPVFTVLDLACRQLGRMEPADTASSLTLAAAATALSAGLAFAIQPGYDRLCKRLARWILDLRQKKELSPVEVPACSHS